LDVIVYNILPFAAVLVVLVVIHELGHFVTAKMAGVKVLEFGIGYPPRLFAFKRGETEYSLNILPLGGFVRLLGEEDPSDPKSLAAQPALPRLVIMGAGSFMNFVLAIALFSLALMIPREMPVGRAVISEVVPGSPAAVAGLKPGDVIQEIGGREIDNVADASYNIRLNLGEDTEIVVRRTNFQTGEPEPVTVRVTPRWAPPPFEHVVEPGQDVNAVAQATGFDRDSVRAAAGIATLLPAGRELILRDVRGEEIRHVPVEGETVALASRALRVPEENIAAAAGLPDQNRIEPGTTLRFPQGATGIRIASQYPYTETRALGPIDAVQRGWHSTFDSLKLARNEFYSWFKGGTSAPVSGPIGIAQATGEVFKEAGWKSLMDLAALLSINLAILNILPLPMLDGGRMAFVVIEVLRRGRRIAPAKEAAVHFVGMVALLILVVVLSYFDVARIVNGESLFR
jgi:regulator of sigma E protease